MTETQKSSADAAGSDTLERRATAAEAVVVERNGAAQPGTALVPAGETGNGASTHTPTEELAKALAPKPAAVVEAPEPEPVEEEAVAEVVEAVVEEPAPEAAPAPVEAPASDMVGPSPRQARAASVLGGVLGAPFDFGAPAQALGANGWWLFQWPALTLAGRPVRPALAGWRRERLPELPLDAWPSMAPDWVCDIVAGPDGAAASEGETGLQAILAEAGVQYLWVIDPVTGALECGELSNGGWVRLGVFYAGETVIAPPFHSSSFPIDALWPD